MQPQQPAPIQAKLEAHPEGQMAKSELYRAAKMSIKLFQMIQDGQELEGWVQAKITKSADYLDSIYHYMEYQMKFGQGGQAASVADITDDMEIIAQAAPSEEDDEEIKVKEGVSYEQRLHALLEGAMKKADSGKKFDPLKHVKNPTPGEKKAAKDVKRGSYADRAAMLKSAEKDGRLKEASKPDFLDMDKDGDKKEPMKKAVADKKAGPKKGVNPFAKKDESVKEGFPTVAKAQADAEKKKTTGKFDVKKTSTGTQYTRKSSTFTDGGDDKDVKAAKKKAKTNEGSGANKTDLAMAYLMAVVNAPIGTPEKRRIRNWQQILSNKFDIEMDTANLAQMLPQLDSQLQSGKLDRLQNRMSSRGELSIESIQHGVAEGIKDVAKKAIGAVKKAGSKALDTLGHGSDEDLIKDLQKKTGMPQTGKKPMAVKNEASKARGQRIAEAAIRK